MRASFLLLLIMMLSACSDDNLTSGPMGFQSDDEFFPTVTPELRPFYEAFEQEAAERGIEIDLTLEAVTGNIVELGGSGILGICRQVPGENSRVAIDDDAWRNSTHAVREIIVFHELGHCVLDRDHLDDQENGVCQSIMNSALANCEIPFENPVLREQFLDELFFN